MKLFKYLWSLYFIKQNPIQYARKQGVKVGKDCRFLGINKGTFGSEPFLIKIGDHVTITNGVQFVTHDGGVWIFREESPTIDVFGTIEIGNNVFVGIKTVILPNVKIGDNVVIGAGSLVTKDIPSNSVAAGSPAKIVRSVEEYKEKVFAKAMFIKNKEYEEKKIHLKQHFNMENENEKN